MNFTALIPLENSIPLYPPGHDNVATYAIQKFCTDNNFEFCLREPEIVEYTLRDVRTLPAWLGIAGYGATKDAYYVVKGSFMEYPFTLFTMWDNLTNGVMYRRPTEQQQQKYTEQQSTGIIKISLPKLFPQIVLDSNKNDGMQSSIRSEYINAQRIQLEGDFSKHFDLFVPIGLQVDALSLLAPNMMQLLISHSGLFDVEFNGSELIFMTRKSLYDPENTKLLFEAIGEQLTYMNRLLPSWNYTPKSRPTDLLEKPFIIGSTLKVGTLRLSAKKQIIIISALLLIFVITMVWLD